MFKLVALFFEEAWLHRRNRFIAVGGAAAFSFFLTYSLAQIPWVPQPVKTSGMVISMSLVFITMLMMLYYVFKFVWQSLLWSYRKISGHGADSFVKRGQP